MGFFGCQFFGVCFLVDSSSESLPLWQLLLLLLLLLDSSGTCLFFLTSVRTLASLLCFLFWVSMAYELYQHLIVLCVYLPMVRFLVTKFQQCLYCASMSLSECHRLKQLSTCSVDPSVVPIDLGALHRSALHKLQPYWVCLLQHNAQ